MSQIYKSSGSGSSGVTSVVGINGITASPTTGDVILSLSDFPPLQNIQDFDDFICINSTVPVAGKFLWIFQSNNSSVDTFTTSPTNPGQIILISEVLNVLPVSFLAIVDSSGLDSGPFQFGGGTFSSNLLVNLGALSNSTNRYTSYIGLTNAPNNTTTTWGNFGLPPDLGIYFEYSDNVNGGRWQAVTNNSGTLTNVDTGIAATNSFTNFGISINATATSVSFFINGTQTANSPITTNIPSQAMTPCVYVVGATGGTIIPNQFVDLWYYSQSLTIAR
jgi:hypothetical protein